MTIFFLFLFIYIMVNFQNKNRIWINNTLKANAETLDILKLLKDIGIFKEKPKKRKPKSKEEEPDMEDTGDEFLTPPSGGGGAGDISAVPPTSQVTQALQALKSGASDTAQQKYLLERAKEEAQLAIGQLRDTQQDLSQRQQRLGFGFQPSRPTVDWLADEEGDTFFPPKDSVVSEPAQEFTQETSGTNVPDEVTDIDVTEKVSPEQGQFEDEGEEEATFIPEQTKPIEEEKPELSIKEKFLLVSNRYNISQIPADTSLTQLRKYYRDTREKLFPNEKGWKTEASKWDEEKTKKELSKLISRKHKLEF